MTLPIAVIVWALVFGLSPGLALTAVALTVLAMDAIDPRLIDRILRREYQLGNTSRRLGTTLTRLRDD